LIEKLGVKGAFKALQAKLGHGSPLCAKFHERIFKQLKNARFKDQSI